VPFTSYRVGTMPVSSKLPGSAGGKWDLGIHCQIGLSCCVSNAGVVEQSRWARVCDFVAAMQVLQPYNWRLGTTGLDDGDLPESTKNDTAIPKHLDCNRKASSQTEDSVPGSCDEGHHKQSTACMVDACHEGITSMPKREQLFRHGPAYLTGRPIETLSHTLSGIVSGKFSHSKGSRKLPCQSQPIV